MAKEINTIGVLTSGGDAPGMNAAIRAVVRSDAAENIAEAEAPIRRLYPNRIEKRRRFGETWRHKWRSRLLFCWRRSR